MEKFSWLYALYLDIFVAMEGFCFSHAKMNLFISLHGNYLNKKSQY